MCFMCNGHSVDELERVNDLAIAVHGWMLCQVAADVRPGWAYTVGLRESFGHPELLCMDLGSDPDVQRFVVDRLANMVADTGSVDRVELAWAGLTLVPVHPSHFTHGLAAFWSGRYGRLPGEDEFLQIVPDASWLDDGEEVGLRLRLDEPAPLPS
jgi:hypothetical protein